MIYGLITVFNKYQSAEYQQSLIKEKYPDCKFFDNFDELFKNIGDGDILVVSDILRLFSLGDFSSFDFDTVFATVFKNYQAVFSRGSDIAVLSCPALDSEIFRSAIMRNLSKGSSSTEMAVSEILEAQIKLFLKDLYVKNYRKRQSLRKSIKESEKNRSRKGIKLNIKKQQPCKDFMLKHLKDFGGNMSNDEVIAELKIARNTFFKYKKELLMTFDTSSDTISKSIDTTVATVPSQPTQEPSPAPEELSVDKSTSEAPKALNKLSDESSDGDKKDKKKKKDKESDQIEGQTSLFDYL